MKILYIWVNDYKCFKNDKGYSLNLSEDYRFEFKDDRLVLLSKGKYESCSVFSFDTNKVVDNISVIVGSNGSGKTTLLHLLYDIFFLPSIGSSVFSYVIVFELNGKIYYKSNRDLDVSNVGDIKAYKSGLSSLYMIYHSNLFSFVNPFPVNPGIFTYGDHKFINTSTSYLLTSVYEKSDGENKKTGIVYSNTLSNIDWAKIREMNRCVDFVASHNTKNKHEKFDLGITIPEKIRFYIDNNDEKFFKDEIINNNKIDFSNLKEIYSLISQISFDKNYLDVNKLSFLYDLTVALFCNYFRTHIKKTETFELEDKTIKLQIEIFNKVFDSSFVDDFKSPDRVAKGLLPLLLLRCLKDYFEKLKDVYKENDISLDNEKAILLFLEYIGNVKDSKIKFGEFKNENGDYFVEFDIINDSDIIKEFYKLYTGSKILTEYLSREFYPSPSDGEFNIITTYSRLYNKFSNECKECKNMILLLDEVEITFHPSLQRKFIKSLIDFFNIFKPNNDLKVQVIIATHSPIILSDIPSTNVIFLKKNPQSNSIECVNQGNNVKTFASNILELYNNSFFMDKFIGEFAESKIKEIIKKKELNNADEQLIDDIGDIILKRLIRDKISYNKNADAIEELKRNEKD